MKKHLKIVSMASIAALLATAAQAESRNYDHNGFSRVAAAAGTDVRVSVGGGYSVRAEGDTENLELLKITQSGSTLKVGRQSGFNSRWKGRRSPIIYVTLPSLEGADASSGAELDASGIDADRFSANVSSGGELSLGGSCGSMKVSASSGGELNADGFKCSDVDVSISSGAEANVYASQSIEASASSGGEVNVYGSPKNRNIHKSIGGDVDFM